MASKGFGYIEVAAVCEDAISLSDDSHMSSTSLLKDLIKPTSSEKLVIEIEDPERGESFEMARHSLRESLPSLRRSQAVDVEGLNIDYKERRKADSEREFQQQYVPRMSDYLHRTYSQRYSAEERPDDIAMPLMSALGIREERPSWKRLKSAQMVKDMLKERNESVDGETNNS